MASAHSSERTRSVPCRGRVPLVEDQVDDGQHVGEPVGQFRVARHPVRDAGGPDLALGPDQALGNRRLRHEERARDLGGLEPGDQPQREGQLGLGGQRRVAAGEDQPEAVVLHRSHLLGGFGAGLHANRLGLPAEPGRLAAQPVERLVAGRGDDPAARVGRYAGGRPALGRDGEGLLDRLLGEVDVAEEADQGGHRASRALPEGALDGGSVGAGHVTTPRGSPGTAGPRPAPPQASDPLAAQRQRGVQVGGLDDPEAAELLLGLGERTVGGDDLAALAADHRGGGRRVQAAGEHPGAGRLQLGVEGVHRLVRPLDLLRRTGPVRPRSMCTDSRYCFMSSLLLSGRRSAGPLNPVHERVSPESTPGPKISAGPGPRRHVRGRGQAAQ